VQDDFQKTLQAAKPLLEELSTWHTRFEQQNQLLQNEDDAPVSCVHICRLGFEYIKINIFRAIMRPFLRRPNHSTLAPDATQAQRQARTGARSCTRNAFEFLYSLNQEHVHMFWPQWTRSVYSAVTYFMLLMFITSDTSEEALDWIQDLQRMRKELRIRASLHTFLRLGQLRVDSIFWKDLRKVVDLKPQVSKAFEESYNTAASRPSLS
jgi:hypothetical protein